MLDKTTLNLDLYKIVFDIIKRSDNIKYDGKYLLSGYDDLEIVVEYSTKSEVMITSKELSSKNSNFNLNLLSDDIKFSSFVEREYENLIGFSIRCKKSPDFKFKFESETISEETVETHKISILRIPFDIPIIFNNRKSKAFVKISKGIFYQNVSIELYKELVDLIYKKIEIFEGDILNKMNNTIKYTYCK